MNRPTTRLQRIRTRLGLWLLREGKAKRTAAPSISGSTVANPAKWRPGTDPLCVSAVFRCVTLVSSAVASMPLRYLKRRDGGVKAPYESSPLYWLLTVEPNPDTSAFEFWRTAVRRMLCDGAVFILPMTDPVTGEVKELRQVSADCVTCYRDRHCYSVHDAEQGLYYNDVPENDIIFLRGLSSDGYRGESTTAYTTNTAEVSRAAEDEALNRIENGGSPRYFIQSESPLIGTGSAVEGSLDKFLTRLDLDLHDDGKGAIPLPDGVKAIPAGSTAADMQFQSMREFAVREICRFFGVPPTFVFSDGAANYKTTEAAQLDFLQNTLDPILRNIEGELHRKLVRRSRWGSESFEFDRTSRMSIDSDSRAKYYTQMLGAGAYTVNDIRKFVNLPPVKGGDTPCISANLRPLSEVSSGTGTTSALAKNTGNNSDTTDNADNTDNTKDTDADRGEA